MTLLVGFRLFSYLLKVDVTDSFITRYSFQNRCVMRWQLSFVCVYCLCVTVIVLRRNICGWYYGPYLLKLATRGRPSGQPNLTAVETVNIFGHRLHGTSRRPPGRVMCCGNGPSEREFDLRGWECILMEWLFRSTSRPGEQCVAETVLTGRRWREP